MIFHRRTVPKLGFKVRSTEISKQSVHISFEFDITILALWMSYFNVLKTRNNKKSTQQTSNYILHSLYCFPWRRFFIFVRCVFMRDMGYSIEWNYGACKTIPWESRGLNIQTQRCRDFIDSPIYWQTSILQLCVQWPDLWIEERMGWPCFDIQTSLSFSYKLECGLVGVYVRKAVRSVWKLTRSPKP